MASHKENQWIWKGKKFKCKPGQFVTSLQSIANESGCTSMNIRTSLRKFEKLEFLTNQSTKTGRLISIVNWETYQGQKEIANKETNKELTKHQQRANNYQQSNNETIDNKVPYAEIINHLNKKAKTKYRHTTKNTQKFIKARFSEKFILADFFTVIDNKCKEWLYTDMAKYIRPETLFGSKFESYLQNCETEPKTRSAGF